MPVGSQVLMGSDLRTFRKAVENASRPPTFTDAEGVRHFGKPETHLRYLIAGEFGHCKGRAHWHGLFFLEGKPLELPPRGSRELWRYWPHGFVWRNDVDRLSIRYACKYLLKASDADSPQHAGSRRRAFYSKKPPLGDDYFDDMARRLAQAGLAIHDGKYRFREVTNSKGKPYEYYMTGRTLELFCERYVAYWPVFNSGRLPRTEFLDRAYLDHIARRERYLDMGDLAEGIAAKHRERLLLQERRRAFQASRPDRLYELRDVGTLLLEGRASVVVAASDGTVRFSGPFDGASCRGRSAAEFFPGAASFGLSGSEAETVWQWLRRVAVRFDPVGVAYLPAREEL
jgi:hypothetical protein